MSAFGYGICPRCKGRFAITARGSCRKHKVRVPEDMLRGWDCPQREPKEEIVEGLLPGLPAMQWRKLIAWASVLPSSTSEIATKIVW